MRSDRKSSCYEDLKRRVLALEIAPGAQLDEVELSTAYNLSRTPLREVFQRLAGEGYLDLEANRGATVSSMDFEVMRSFFQTAPLIYCAVARLAAENATATQLANLRGIQARFRKAVTAKSFGEMSSLNHTFHEAIGEMSGSVYLRPSLNRLLIDHTRMSHRFYRPRTEIRQRRVKLACDQHEAMIEAFKKGDPDRAAKLTLEHWELSRSEIEKYVQPDPLPMGRAFEYLEGR